MRPALRVALGTPLLLVALLGSGAQAQAQETLGPWRVTAFLQQSWPKQTETNRQIREDINGTLGTHFKTWDDVANLNLGVVAYRALNPVWSVGFELDYSTGGIEGREGVADFGLGPGAVAFEQRYSVYADALLMVQVRPFGAQGRWVPFASLGAGYAYEKDRTTLGFSSSVGAGDVELLRVDNSGWFPMLTVGAGVDVYLDERRTWYLEAGLSYGWARLKHGAAATGLLAPGPTVTADTDSTGRNLWLGLGRRF